jgi:CMP-N,N'-diacetyllegionaminic acid synthase
MKIIPTLAIIPARAGSKGIQGKNIALLAGVPLIVHTVRAACSSRSIDRVMVSTDSKEIAEIARNAGAEIPYLRPPHLADDHSHLADVLEDLLLHVEKTEGAVIETVVTLLPTNPLRTAEDIDGAIETFRRVGADNLGSVSIAPSHPQACVVKKDEDGALDFYLPREQVESNGLRQKRKTVYVSNGAIGIARRKIHSVDAALKLRYIPDSRWYVYEISEISAFDINTPLDLFIAEHLIKYRKVIDHENIAVDSPLLHGAPELRQRHDIPTRLGHGIPAGDPQTGGSGCRVLRPVPDLVGGR